MTTLKREIGIIPGPAYVVAAVVFVTIPFMFFHFAWNGSPEWPSLPLRIAIAMIPATFLAFIVLMVGYVNRDAGRRGMSRALWTTLVIVIPNALGFILYFLLRQPLRTQCPQCGNTLDGRANFCSKCGYSFNPTCPQCKAAVRPADTFCSNCGAQLKTPQ